MNRESTYFKRASLMLKVIPYVAKESCFALKGGTAINFFYQDMPRLSVDIDLTYLPIEDFDLSLQKISDALQRIGDSLKKAQFKVQFSRNSKGRLAKLVVSDYESMIKVEPNDVIRGTVYPPVERDTTDRVEELFEASASIASLTIEDLYAGKLCAALDRQHPRDLFDMMTLLSGEGITDGIRKTFVVYLSCHGRPINELIEPTRKDIKDIFDQEFVGMTTEPVKLDDLLDAREKYIKYVSTKLTSEERRFLISLKEGSPEWNLLDLPGIENLPAVQWKLKNIQNLKKTNPKNTVILSLDFAINLEFKPTS